MPWLSTPRMLPYGKRHVDAGHIGAGLGKRADQAGARIRRAADDLHWGGTVALVNHQHPQLVGIRMLDGRDDLGDDEGLVGRLVVDILDLEADGGQPLADLVERGIGFQMVLQPGECEFHRSFLLIRSNRRTASARRAGGNRNGSSSARRR